MTKRENESIEDAQNRRDQLMQLVYGHSGIALNLPELCDGWNCFDPPASVILFEPGKSFPKRKDFLILCAGCMKVYSQVYKTIRSEGEMDQVR